METVYRLKVWFEDFPDVERLIDVRADQTFEDLHRAILNSVGFDQQQLASFFIKNGQNGQKEITLIDMSLDGDSEALIMEQTKLGEFINRPGEIMRYEYDFVLLWSFFIQVEDALQPEAGKEYPVLVAAQGDAPDQYETTEKYPEALTEEDERAINEYQQRGGIVNGGADDEELDDEIRGLFSDFEDGGDDDDRF